MKKILFLTSRYLPDPSANGINTEHIVKELKMRGYQVTCISVKRENNEKSFEIIEETPIYRVSPSVYSRILHKENTSEVNKIKKLFYKIAHYLRKIKLALLILNFPNFDLLQARKVYKLARLLHKKEKYDCIIGVYKPFTNIVALKKMKKKFPDLLSCAYYLDLINSSPKPSFMPSNIYDWLCYKGDYKAFIEFDFILMAKGGMNIYNKPQYNMFESKIKYIDFPTFNPLISAKKDNGNFITKHDVVIITYAGTLDDRYRNPSYLLEALKEMSVSIGKIELNIFGTGNCDAIINKYQENETSSFQVIRHGFKNHDIVLNAMKESHFLVNISNNFQNAVPSKIFEIFSVGKPIINVVSNKEDISLDYFHRYPSVLTLSVWENLTDQLTHLQDFILKEKGREYGIEEIKSMFIESTPGYTVNIIEEFLHKNMELYND